MKIQEMLAIRGGEIKVDSIARVLGRTPPPKEYIENARKTLYLAASSDFVNNRPSINDEDWVENPTNGLARSQSFGNNNPSQKREWRPQMTTTSLTTATQIGATTTITQNPTTGGPGALPKSNPMANVPPGAPMGFISSRQVLSMLPPEQLNNPVLQKRKSDGPPAPKRTAPGTLDRKSIVLPEFRPARTATIVDRAKPTPCGPVIPLLQSSSPHPGIEVDALPSLSFSSPMDLKAESDDEFKDLPATSPLAPIKPAAKRTKKSTIVVPPPVANQGSGRGRGRGRPAGRSMKPWPMTNRF